jgi:hypothetical protein
MQRQVVVISEVRTAIGKFGEKVKDLPPTELGSLSGIRLARRVR